MEVTEVLQSCTAVTVEDILRYRIGMAVLTKGELPHEYIFVYTILTEDNPGNDEFTRVANVEDIQNMPQSRDAAVDAGTTLYLSISSEYFYTDVNTAISAKDALTTRINELINTWILYQDGFIDTDGLTIRYPTADPGYEQALKDAYAEARAARVAAEADVVSADTAVTTSKQVLSYEKKIYDIYVDTCKLVTKVWISDGAGDIEVYRSKINTGGTEGAEATAYWPTVRVELVALKSAACDQVPAQASVVSNADDAVSDALSAKEEAGITLATAQAAEDEALAAVLSVCPSFDPATV